MKKKVYICLLALCVFLTGCGTSAGTGAKKEAEDWRTDKIIGDSNCTGIWREGITENDKYVFYLRDDYKIVRFDKEKKTKKAIVTLKKYEDSDYVNLSLALDKDKLYYLYQGNLHQCDFDGTKDELLIKDQDLKDGGKLKDKKTQKHLKKIENYGLRAIYVYNGKIYTNMNSFVFVLDLKTKSVQRVTEIAWHDIHFYKGYVYGFASGDPSIYRTNLETGIEEPIRGRSESNITKETKKYRELFAAGDKLYYSCWLSNGDYCLYEYREDGKDKEVYRINKYGEDGFYQVVSDSMKLINIENQDPDDANKDGKRKITVTDVETGEKKEGEFKGDFNDVMYSIDGSLICSNTKFDNKESGYVIVALP